MRQVMSIMVSPGVCLVAASPLRPVDHHPSGCLRGRLAERPEHMANLGNREREQRHAQIELGIGPPFSPPLCARSTAR